MCTVTFVPNKNRTIITSNRDELAARTAINPKVYEINGKEILFPKDPKGGGSWFCVRRDGVTGVLLNGAKEKHISTPPYKISRGIILVELLATNDCIMKWNQFELNQFEPFTIILYLGDRLFQLRWDGSRKESTELDVYKPHIWSSATLYSKEVQNQKTDLFTSFMMDDNAPGADKILDFHRNKKGVDGKNALIINRNDILKTVSISQAVIENGDVDLTYIDLLTDTSTSSAFVVKQ